MLTICVFMDLFRDFSIITWNIRGAWGQSSMRQVCDIVNLHYPSLFLVFETHGHFSRVEDFWNKLGCMPLFVQEVVGHSWGIWVLSFIVNITCSLIHSMNQAITFSIKRRNILFGIALQFMFHLYLPTVITYGITWEI